MARNKQEGPLERRNKTQSERDLIASAREAEMSGLGIAAGAMILGAVLPQPSSASDHREEWVNPPATVADEHVRIPATEEASVVKSAAAEIHQFAVAAPAEPADASGHVISDSTAVTPALGDHTDYAHEPLPSQSGPAPIEGRDSSVPTHAVSESSASEPGASSFTTQDAAAADHALTEISSTFSEAVSHAVDAVSGSLGDAVGLINNAASSVSQALTGALGNLSSTIGDLVHTLNAPFEAALDSPVDSILHDPALNVLDQLHGSGSLAAVTDSATAMLGSISTAAFGGSSQQSSDGVIAETLGPSSDIGEMHSSAASFGELTQSVHIGFAGQPLGHTIEPHDISTHGSGSILHGFV